MRRIAIAAALAGLAMLAARVLAPKLHARILAACEHMFERVSDDFPPKRVMRGVEEVRANTARTLELLQEATHAGKAEPLFGEAASREDEMAARPAEGEAGGRLPEPEEVESGPRIDRSYR